MRPVVLTAAVMLAALSPVLAAAQPAAGRPMDPDRPARIDGVLAACTGRGESRIDPQWLTYSIRLEFTGARGQTLTGEVVTIYNAANRPILHLACGEPWLLLNLPPGAFLAEAQIAGEADLAIQRVGMHPPEHGQTRVVVQFPDAS